MSRSNGLLLEIVPPLRAGGTTAVSNALDYIRRVAEELQIDAVNIPEIHEERQRCGDGNSLTPCEARIPVCEFAARIKDNCGIDCIVNHAVVYQSAEHLAQWLEAAWQQFGIRRFVLVGGESSRLRYPGPGVDQANAITRHLFADREVRIGNICIPSRHAEATRVQNKIRAGADFFTTQIIYDPGELIALSCALLDANVDPGDTEFYISFCPVKSQWGISFLDQLGVILPNRLRGWLLEDREHMLEHSKQHICGIWQQFLHHIQGRHPGMRIGINLSPIGRIDVGDTIDLGRRLLEVL